MNRSEILKINPQAEFDLEPDEEYIAFDYGGDLLIIKLSEVNNIEDVEGDDYRYCIRAELRDYTTDDYRYFTTKHYTTK